MEGSLETPPSHCLYRFLDSKKLAASNLAFQAFETKNNKKISILAMAFLENPLFVLFPAWILDLADPGACYEYFF